MKNSVKIAVLCGIAVLLVGFQVVRFATRETPTRHTDMEEAQVGQRLAELIDARTADGGVVTVVVLFRQGVMPYQTRIDTLVADLSATATVQVIWARDEKLYNDDNYTATIDAALDRQPGTQTLVVIGGGSVTHADVSPRLQAFLDAQGELVLNGGTSRDSAFVQLAQAGHATILARRTTWLQSDAETEAETTGYVDRHYVLLPGEG